jgi:hypothetical protein
MTSGHYCDGCAQAYYKCVCNKQEEKIIPKKMNERIKQLAEQASKEAFPVGSMAWMETFAELIVRECSNFLKDTLDDHFAAEQLEEHFGVES